MPYRAGTQSCEGVICLLSVPRELGGGPWRTGSQIRRRGCCLAGSGLSDRFDEAGSRSAGRNWKLQTMGDVVVHYMATVPGWDNSKKRSESLLRPAAHQFSSVSLINRTEYGPAWQRKKVSFAESQPKKFKDGFRNEML